MDQSNKKMGIAAPNVQTRREKRSRNNIEATAPPVASKVAKTAENGDTKSAPPVFAPIPAPAPAGGTLVFGAAKSSSMLEQAQEHLKAAAGNLFAPSKKKYVYASRQPRQSRYDLAPSSPPPPVPVPDDSTWKEKIMPHLCRCTSSEGIRESSHFSKTASVTPSSTSRNSCLRRLLQELVALEDDLPDTLPGIWLRYDEECPQFMRCLMAAPQGTPYALGLFCFDIWIPDSYPTHPPKMQLLTTGGGTVRFSPNLYADGKVCLSLLGTWSGPKWNPLHSSLLQVLMSIQGLILGVQNPYYLEPGHGGWEGQVKSNPTMTTTTKTKNQKSGNLNVPTSNASSSSAGTSVPAVIPGGATVVNTKINTKEDGTTETIFTTIPVVDSTQPVHVQQYEDRLRIGTLKYAILDMLKNAKNDNLPLRHYLYPFKDIILCHLYHCKASIIPTASIFFSAIKSSTQRQGVQSTVDELEKTLQELPKPLIIQLAEGAKEKSDTTKAEEELKFSSGVGSGGSVVETIICNKRKSLSEAVAAEDYVTAARLQQELKHLGDAAVTTHCSIEDRIRAKTQAMEAAAEAKDYISAGQHQASLRRLTKNKRVLQNLERRMFDAASKLDYVRAGNFQTQFKLLLEQSEHVNGSARSLAKEASYKNEGKSNSFASYPSSFAAVADAAASASKSMSLSKLYAAPVVSLSSAPQAMANIMPPLASGPFFDDGFAYPEIGYDDEFLGDY